MEELKELADETEQEHIETEKAMKKDLHAKDLELNRLSRNIIPKLEEQV